MENKEEYVHFSNDKNGIGTLEFFHPQSNSLPRKKLNKMTDYAVDCLGTLARKPGYSMSATELSRETGLRLYTVQKLLKLLVSKSDFISANRGPLGGYVLNKNSSDI